MNLPKLSEEEKKQFKNGVIQVNGKAMNRTALGIIAAYFKLNPNTTFSELKKAFPDSINPSGPRRPKSIFKPFTDRDFGVVHSLEEIKKEFGKADIPYEDLFFTEEDEVFKTSDGIIVIVNKLWESADTETGENDLENLAKVALNYGIVINKFEAKTPFSRGSYSLDILNSELYNKIIAIPISKTKVIEKEKKIIPFWVWILLGITIILLFLWLLGLLGKNESEPIIIEKEVFRTDTITVEKEVMVVDTVYYREIEVIETDFNSVQFEADMFDIPEGAKYALYDLSKLMQNNLDLKVEIIGHTSDEGNVDHNQNLSENRAKAVVDFLIERGVEKSRLSYKGVGSSEPISSNREENRRTEFKIIE